MTKKEIRKTYKAKRADLSFKKRDELSDSIAERLLANFDLTGKTVSIFLPIERFNEINTWKIIDHVDANFVLPVLDGDNLKHILFESKEQLKITDWGIPEPTYGVEVDIKEIDLVVVPLLAIDKNGYRVGYGKGFYDRFLAACKNDCLFVGVNYFEPIDEIEGLFEGDIPLHYCVSPKEIYEF